MSHFDCEALHFSHVFCFNHMTMMPWMLGFNVSRAEWESCNCMTSNKFASTYPTLAHRLSSLVQNTALYKFHSKAVNEMVPKMHSKPWDRYTVSWRDRLRCQNLGYQRKPHPQVAGANRPSTNRSRMLTPWPSWYLSRGDLFWAIHIQQHSVTTSQESSRLVRCREGWKD